MQSICSSMSADTGRQLNIPAKFFQSFAQYRACTHQKTVDVVYRSTLMVSSKQEEVMWILDLVAHHEAHCLDALICTVHVITQKDVPLVWRKSAHLENLEEIVSAMWSQIQMGALV